MVMIHRPSISILLAAACLTLSCCTRQSSSQKDPTGLKRSMTIEQTVDVLGDPSTVKAVGENRLLYIYKRPNETVAVFFINRKIKSIDHIARDPRIAH